MATRNLNFADGQLPAVAAAIAQSLGDSGQWINGIFANVGTVNETVVLTLARNGGTQRRVFRVSLDPNEMLHLGGLAMNSGDVLYAVTTDAGTVDYILSIAPDNTPLSAVTFGEDGTVRMSTTGFFNGLAAVD